MPKPSLRELLMNIRVDHHGTALFLEALVGIVERLMEAVEGLQIEEPTCGDCGFFALDSVFPCDRAPKPRKPLQGVHGGAGACKNFTAKVGSEETPLLAKEWDVGSE